ncbi:nucleotidyltransferase family protein [candidate division CSSED10-310 bacterium]|uniref:Nucleotidyltransferase family protein n=1 Tax=candidate division CSSED10-310 bacterium TaxID=2855610 RepID=A0ABV6Z0L8_UNCC1
MQQSLIYLLAHPDRLKDEQGAEEHFITMLEVSFAQELADLAIANGVGEVLFQKLNKYQKSLSPSVLKVMDQLKLHYLESCAKSMMLFTAAEKIGLFFKQAGIDFLFIKGVPILKIYYLQGLLRRMLDIDILYNSDQTRQVQEVMSTLDYQLKKVDPRQQRLANARGLQFMKTDHRRNIITPIDMHWELLEPQFSAFACLHQSSNKFLTIDNEELFRERTTFYINKEKFETLSPVNTFLFLCWDITLRMRFWKLSNFTDMVMVLDQIDDDEVFWDELIDKAHRYRTRKTVFVALKLFANFMFYKIPDRIYKKLNVSAFSNRGFQKLIGVQEQRCFERYFRHKVAVRYTVRLGLIDRTCHQIQALTIDIFRIIFPASAPLLFRFGNGPGQGYVALLFRYYRYIISYAVKALFGKPISWIKIHFKSGFWH